MYGSDIENLVLEIRKLDTTEVVLRVLSDATEPTY